ncbi:MAG: CheY-like receiver [Ignavibacteria bacterium]|nr:MAG: CheY-like receiver [Ignavibacteria bacterium]KAF0160158.1 MAG: CheY-like receiver [Ignavibacteria bacterium]
MNFENDKVKILVIDDADVIRNSLKKFLSEYDVEVITCNDGLEGLQSAVEIKPQLIILDLMMPNLDGIRLLRVLKVLEDLKRIPVIIISGHTDKTNVMAAMEAGAEKIVSKPLTKEVLVKAINDVLGSNFLANTKKLAQFSSYEKDLMNKELKKYFINTIVQKKETIKQSLVNKNKDLLKLIVHELKGSSGTVGYTNVSELCREIEIVVLSPQSTWLQIENKCQLLLGSLTEIETSLAK